MDPSVIKIRAARTAVATASGLAIIKLIAGVMTGSLAVLASALDSLLDIIMSGVNYFAIKHAEQPADECHPFGHGKFETAATLVQSAIIAATGLLICSEGVRRLTGEIELVRIEGGMIVLLFSVAASAWISRYLRRVAKLTDSSALKADSLHFGMDVYTNLALLFGLVLINIFEAAWIDPALSLLVGIYIIYEAVKLLRHGMRDMLDEELPEPIRAEVERLIRSHQGDLVGFHNLRTRRAGSQKIMDFHLTVCRHLTVEQAHEIADGLEKTIESGIYGADVTIHIEPCRTENCPGHDQCDNDKTRLHKEGNG